MVASALQKYVQDKGIKFIVLFGSYATKTAGESSDFDIAVYLKGNRSLFDDLSEYSDILCKIGGFLGINPDKMDLTDLNSANILLRYDVTSKGELLYGNADEYQQFKAFAFREYVDARPLFDLEDFLIKKRQELIGQALG